MVRATEGDVKSLLEVTNDDVKVQPFIKAATALVDWLVSRDVDNELSTALTIEIEKYLACHLYTFREQQYAGKNTGRAAAQFQGQTGMVLSSSFYGQTAMTLDVTGRLAQRSKDAELGNNRRASMTWLGRKSNETHSYDR